MHLAQRLNDICGICRVVLSALRGPAWRLPASCPASRNVLTGMSSRRWTSQLPPGVKDGEALSSVSGSVSKGKKNKASENTDYVFNYHDHLERKHVKEAVDVSGGTAPYKVLSSKSGVFFYQQDGSLVSKHRSHM